MAIMAMREYFLLGRPQPGPLLFFQSVTISAEGSFHTSFGRVPWLRVSLLRASQVTAFASGQPQLLPLLVCWIIDWLIKVLGHWSSDCYQLYIRTLQTVLYSVAPKLATVLDYFSTIKLNGIFSLSLSSSVAFMHRLLADTFVRSSTGCPAFSP